MVQGHEPHSRRRSKPSLSDGQYTVKPSNIISSSIVASCKDITGYQDNDAFSEAESQIPPLASGSEASIVENKHKANMNETNALLLKEVIEVTPGNMVVRPRCVDHPCHGTVFDVHLFQQSSHSRDGAGLHITLGVVMQLGIFGSDPLIIYQGLSVTLQYLYQFCHPPPTLHNLCN